MAYFPAGGGTYFLNSSISSTATSITLSSFTEPVSGTPYTMVLLNTDIAYGTISPKTTSSEFISFTGITQNADGTATLTGVTRGLAKKSPFTASATFRLPHSGKSQFILSDAPQVFVKYGAKDNDEVLTGFWEAPDPVTAQGLVTRDYMLNLINGGTISVNKVVVTGTAGETVAAGQAVYLKSADGRWWLTDADTASTVENVVLGIAQGAGTAGNSISGGVMLPQGVDNNQTGLSANTIYYYSNTAGAFSTSPGTKEVTAGIALSTTSLAFMPRYNQQLTEDEQDAIAGGGDYGTPSGSNKFITQSYNSSASGLPVVRVYTANDTWTKPSGLKYVMAEVVGGGGGGGGADTDAGAGGGGGGGYSMEILQASSLGATEAVTVGAAGAAGADTGGDGGAGGTSSFGTVAFLQATGGAGGAGGTSIPAQRLGGLGGAGSSGTLNIEGDDGDSGAGEVSGTGAGGRGGSSHYGGGGRGGKGSAVGGAGNNYGGGGGGAAANTATNRLGGAGAAGVVIITEYYS